MCNVAITPSTPPVLAQAIAEGAVAAENKALRETIDMLLCEIAQKNELIELYRWERQRAGEEMLRKYRRKHLRPSIWRCLMAVVCNRRRAY